MYAEQLVKKNATLKDMAIRTFATAAAVLVSYAFMILIGLISIIFISAIIVGIYFVYINTSVEYEYSIAGDRLTIDAIYGRKRRKNLFVYEVTKSEIIAPKDNAYVSGYDRNQEMKSYDFTSGNDSENIYIMITPYGASTCKVYFEPNQKIVDAIKTVAPSKIKM